MAMNELKEGLNLPASSLQEFFEDIEGRLSLLTGLTDMSEFGLTLEAVRKPILVVGLPGIGKTGGVMSIIKSLNKVHEERGTGIKINLKKILLGQTVVGSLSGIPVVQPDGSVVRVQIPDLPDPQRDGEYGVLFLDEITTADEAQVQPALGLCDDSRNIGTYTLPEHWLVVAAGNGPDCTNFVRLDDMTITRFTAYDIKYNYKKDWRHWAHENGIDSNIIACLNFDDSLCVRVESSDADIAGKMFPCPRTWTRLSDELKMRLAMKKPVTDDQLEHFAGRIIGIRAAREFAAFCAYNQKVDYSPEKIIKGEERAPEQMPKQSFHILIQACIKQLKNNIEGKGDGRGNYPRACYEMVANFMRWMLLFETFDFENCLQAITEARTDAGCITDIISDSCFLTVCPEFDEFVTRNMEALFSNLEDIMQMG